MNTRELSAYLEGEREPQNPVESALVDFFGHAKPARKAKALKAPRKKGKVKNGD